MDTNLLKKTQQKCGLPWHFKYQGYPVTYENNECYLIPTLEGTHNFTPLDVLITGVKGEIYPCKIDIFEATYDIVEVDLKTTDYQWRPIELN